jgi:hypothetical protein
MARGAPWLVSDRGRMKRNSPLARYSRAPLAGRGDPLGWFPARVRGSKVAWPQKQRGHDAVTVRRAGGLPGLAGPVTWRHVTWTCLGSTAAAAAHGGRRRAGTRSYELTCELVGGRTSARDASVVGGWGAECRRGGSRALQVHRTATLHMLEAPRQPWKCIAANNTSSLRITGTGANGSTAIARAGPRRLGDSAPSLSPASWPRCVKKVWNVTVQ